MAVSPKNRASKPPKSIGAFLADKRRLRAWLEEEEVALAARGTILSSRNWEGHLCLVIVGRKAVGEFHAHADGTVSLHVEVEQGNTIKSARAKIGDERGLKEQYGAFLTAIAAADQRTESREGHAGS